MIRAGSGSRTLDAALRPDGCRTREVAAIAAAGVLAVIANGKPGFDLKASGFAANGWGAHSPGLYSFGAGFTSEVVLTAFFVLVILFPARSTGPAVFVGGWAIRQLWMFWLAPLVGAAIIYPVVQPEEPPTTTEARPVLADRV